MKIITVLSQILLLTTSFTCADSSKTNSVTNKYNNIAENGFAVVELFTSEGCSSCPSADNVVAKLLKQHSSNVYVLGYHVDYWNNLGWKDIFSSAAYTQLQRNYARTFKLSSVYTPQIVVNGTQQFVGSDENKLNAAVNNYLQEPPKVKLDVDAKTSDNKTVNVSFNTDAANTKVKIALVQLNAENRIQRGENSGATLHHVNIVRDLKIADASANGNVSLNIPQGLSAKDCKVIAFTQNASDNKITMGVEADIK